jgi:hypothetical protein
MVLLKLTLFPQWGHVTSFDSTPPSIVIFDPERFILPAAFIMPCHHKIGLSDIAVKGKIIPGGSYIEEHSTPYDFRNLWEQTTSAPFSESNIENIVQVGTFRIGRPRKTERPIQ